jgi:hypothetical protein
MLKKNCEILKDNNVSIIADKGYDSQNIRTYVSENGFSVIIPKNIRNKDSAKIKAIKQAEKESNDIKRKELMLAQKTQTKLKQQKLSERKKLTASKTNINKISINKLDKIIKNITTKLTDIKNERKNIPKLSKENIKNKINILDPKNDKHNCASCNIFRTCAFCNNDKVCAECEKCKKCKKNLKYYKGLSNEQIIRYKKRVRVEHYISHPGKMEELQL